MWGEDTENKTKWLVFRYHMYDQKRLTGTVLEQARCNILGNDWGGREWNYGVKFPRTVKTRASCEG